MRTRRFTLAWLVAGAMLVVASACAPSAEEPRPEEPLETEEIGGAVDAELSTEEDPRGPRRGKSDKVLPAGFPVDLPLAAGLTVRETGVAADGQSFVVLEGPTEASDLASGWRSLLEEEGWETALVSDTHFTASKSGRSIRAIIAPYGSGSRLRIVYR